MSTSRSTATAAAAAASSSHPRRRSIGGRELDDSRIAQLYQLGLLSPSKHVKFDSSPASPHLLDSSRHSTENNTTATVVDPNAVAEPIRGAVRASALPERGSSRGVSQQQQQQKSPKAPPLRSRRGMTGMLDIDRSHTRRERTFAGSDCIICSEDLAVTLRGERILQLSCAHVCHEACFYEYIRGFDSHSCPGCNATLGLDSSRGGNVLDIEKLSNIVRSLQAQISETPKQNDRSMQNTPVPWEQGAAYTPKPSASPQTRAHRSDPQMHAHTPSRESVTTRDSNGRTSVDPYAYRRHDYDNGSEETATASHRSLVAVRHPIPPPTVFIRSEYPTITRSKQQQTLTCLVTVEMPEGKWRPHAEDIRPLSRPPSASTERTHQTLEAKPSQPESAPEMDELSEELDSKAQDLFSKVDNWHGLDFSKFGRLRIHSTLQVGKDRQSWQELECYLFGEMLICVKEKRAPQSSDWASSEPQQQQDHNQQQRQGLLAKGKCTLKGSIMIKKHLNQIDTTSESDGILTLNLSVAELPSFHLHFVNQEVLETWRDALASLNGDDTLQKTSEYAQERTDSEDEEGERESRTARETVSSVQSSYGASRSMNTAPTEYSDLPVDASYRDHGPSSSLHIPIDLVVAIPVSSSMHGLKISVLRDSLKFIIRSLGDRDRIGLVSFGTSAGASPLVGMTPKAWPGWAAVIDSVRPVGQKHPRADLVEGANVAMDILMQRKSANPVSSIMIVSDAPSSETDNIDFVVSRAEAAKVSIHCFGLGLTHKPDAMIELSTRTKASYTYVKDWMMLRECLAGCLGSLQTVSHQNVRLNLKLPDGSPAKFVKISGALQTTKRANGRDVEASLGDLRIGDKRDLLVQLAIVPERVSSDQFAEDPWETIVSDLEALGGPIDQDESRGNSVEEVPLIQADIVYNDILREGAIAQIPRPSLLAITMLPAPSKGQIPSRPATPPIPPDHRVVQRRMELLTSDMLKRALTLVSRGQHERAHHLLRETRSILKGLGKGGLPPLPSRSSSRGPSNSTNESNGSIASSDNLNSEPRPPSPLQHGSLAPVVGIDTATMTALDAELESSLEWINHPAVFGRDSRKAVLQAIGVITSQRAYTFRTPLESLWAYRIAGVRTLSENSKAWREAGEEALIEEA